MPAAIAAGCDAFLFFNDPPSLAEDFGFMRAGVEAWQGRLDDTNRRILGLEAKLNLHRAAAQGTAPGGPGRSGLRRAPGDTQAADLGITLVKNTLDQLPLRPRPPHIRIYHLTEVGGRR